MAKQAKSTSQVESEYDISKYIDLDDPIFEEEDEDGEYTTIPHREAEIITPGLDSDLEEAVEGYIRAGKVSWGDKRNLRRLAAENKELEDAVRDVDPELLAKTKSYHGIVVGILKEKDSLGQLSLDDSDPYDTEVTEPMEVSDEAKSSKRESNEIFGEIERLEAHRTELNGKRVAALEEIRELTSGDEKDGTARIQKIVSEKLDGIAGLADITKSKVSLEDEEEFERGVGELTDYMENGFDPLAYDEDADFVPAGDADRDRVYSVDELLALDGAKATRETKSPKPSAGPSFGELFGVSAPLEQDSDESAATSTGGSAPSFLDAFSSSESPSELDDALGGENLEPDTNSPADEDSFELEEPSAESVFLPTEPISVAELAELDAEHGPEAAAADLSDSEDDYDEYGAGQEMLAEGAFWSEPAAGGEIEDEPESDDEFDAEAAGFVIDESAPARAVIFEELKAKYGISFEGTPGLED